MKKKVSKLKALAIILVILICAALTLALIPVFASYNDSVGLANYIEGFGIWGAFVLLGFQIFQIILALIPGELVEFTAGVLYGTFPGTVICLAGVLAGELLVYILVKWLRHRYFDKMGFPGEFKKLTFLNDSKKLEYFVFLLFFIPGTPKDALTYFIPMTKIDVRRFLVISCVARIPSVLSSAYAGATFAGGDFWLTVKIYAVIGAISILGMIIHNIIMKKGEKNGRK